MLSPSALPCWRITPASFHQNHRAPSIKGARPKRPAVHVLVRYLFYRPRTVGKGTVESSVCQKSWEKSSSWPQRPQGWVTGSMCMYINRCVSVFPCSEWHTAISAVAVKGYKWCFFPGETVSLTGLDSFTHRYDTVHAWTHMYTHVQIVHLVIYDHCGCGQLYNDVNDSLLVHTAFKSITVFSWYWICSLNTAKPFILRQAKL